MPIPQYNAIQYDVAQYNATAFYFLKRLSDSQGTSDFEINGDHRLLADAVTPMDTIPARSAVHLMTDSAVLGDQVTKQVTNKGLNEIVKTKDWFIGDKRPPVDNWL